MMNMHKRLNILAPFVAIAVISGCGESGSSIKDPEADHCERAAGQLTRDVTGGLGTVGVIETKAWTTDNVRSVRVRFRYPEGNAAGLTFGAVLCTYPFEPAVQGTLNASRRPKRCISARETCRKMSCCC